MTELIKNIANLLKVKTLVTLTIIAGVTYGFVIGLVDAATYCTLAGAVVTYYFTKQQG